MIEKNKKNNNFLTLAHNHKSQCGFSLIEVVVALGVFSIVILITLGAVLSIMNLQRRTNAFRSAQENLSYAFESLAKDIRTGTEYSTSESEASKNGRSDTFVFQSDQNQKITYKLVTEIVDGRAEKKIVKKVEDTGQLIAITSTEIFIDNLEFVLLGAGIGGSDGSGIQPMVRIMLSGKVGVGTKYESAFFLQTSVTRRKFEPG